MRTMRGVCYLYRCVLSLLSFFFFNKMFVLSSHCLAYLPRIKLVCSCGRLRFLRQCVWKKGPRVSGGAICVQKLEF